MNVLGDICVVFMFRV